MTGLVGAIIVSRAGSTDPTTRKPRDVDREFVTLYNILDENDSPFLGDTLPLRTAHRNQSAAFVGSYSCTYAYQAPCCIIGVACLLYHRGGTRAGENEWLVLGLNDNIASNKSYLTVREARHATHASSRLVAALTPPLKRSLLPGREGTQWHAREGR